MGRAALCCAFALSLLPALCAWLPEPGWALAGAFQTALALLAWVALAGVPRRSADDAGVGTLALIGCLMPALALGALADLRAGATRTEVGTLAASGIVLCGLLSAAARFARGSGWHGLLWFALVPCSAALSWAAAVAGPGKFAALLGRTSPLSWALDASARGAAAAPWGALAASALLLVAGVFAGRRGERLR